MSYPPPGSKGTPQAGKAPARTGGSTPKPENPPLAPLLALPTQSSQAATVPVSQTPASSTTIPATYPQYPQYPPSTPSYKLPTSGTTATTAGYPVPLQKGQHAYAGSYFAATPYAYPTGYMNSPTSLQASAGGQAQPATPGAGMPSPYPYGAILPPGTTPYPTAYSSSPSLKAQGKLALPVVVQQPTSATNSTSLNTPRIPAGGLASGNAGSGSTSTTQQVTAAGVGRPGRKPTSFKGTFVKDLRSMMYGFGDDMDPAPDTVNVMEEILMEYIADVCLAAQRSTRKSTFKLEDLRRVLSRPADAKKLARMEELLFMQEDIKRARAQFETDDPAGAVGAVVPKGAPP